MSIQALFSKLFYAVMISPLQPKQPALVQLKSALTYKSPSYARTMSTVNLVDRIIPGVASRLSYWMFRNNRFPWKGSNIQLIAFGTGAAVLKVDWKSGAKVLRLYRKSLGKSASGLRGMAEYYKKNYEIALAWYGGSLDLILPMEFLVLQGLPLVGPVAASLQPYIQAEKRDVLEDFSDHEFAKLMEGNLFLRDQFQFFVKQTLRQWEEGKICYDFLGRENLLLVKQDGGYRLKIVDVGFFKFDLPEFNVPGRIAQIEKKLQRLKHLGQLARSA